MEQEHPQTATIAVSKGDFTERRQNLERFYELLPEYGSNAYWQVIEESDLQKGILLEVLVRCVRVATSNGDRAGRNRIIEIIIRRTQTSNEQWAKSVLNLASVQTDERQMLVFDLYADLCEAIIRALIDPARLFWEENFQHCLRFERKHIYQAFMRREGRWYSGHGNTGKPLGETRRVPRRLIESVDRPKSHVDDQNEDIQIEDERAREEMLAVEHSDLPQLILRLPEKLQVVIWLIFYENRTEKETALVLGVTDRTIRNRLHEALSLLRNEYEPERE